MGLAPFFDRARQGAAQVLRDFDADAFKLRLSEVVVTLAFDGEAATSAEGLASIDMAARLAARLYPRVQVHPIDGNLDLAVELSGLMRSINPDIEIVTEISSDLHVAVIAGASRFNCDIPIYVGSDRWIARVSTTAPVGSGRSLNPFGAGAAACIAMANVFRAVFAERLARPELDADVALSLLNFETDLAAANADLPERIDVGLVQLVGVGAIGNAFVWSMAQVKKAVGALHLIDHEMVELTNLQRYVLSDMSSVDASKVHIAAKKFEGSGISAVPFAATWANYVQGMGHHNFDRVAVALDTVRDRLQVQSSLPRSIVNAWTQSGDLGVSRHEFGGDEACLACMYLPAGQRRNMDEIVAEELGFTSQQDLLNVRALLGMGIPVGEPFVRHIASSLGLDPTVLLPFAHLPLIAFRQKAICGNAIMRAPDGAGADLEVPMAFQSALAGVMLAAEIAGAASGTRVGPVQTRSVVDLMRRMPPRITFPMRKGGTGAAKCICEDPDHLLTYREKYPIAIKENA